MPNIRLRLLANRRVQRGLIITAVLAVVWLLSSLAVAYAPHASSWAADCRDHAENRRLEARESPPQDE